MGAKLKGHKNKSIEDQGYVSGAGSFADGVSTFLKAAADYSAFEQ